MRTTRPALRALAATAASILLLTACGGQAEPEPAADAATGDGAAAEPEDATPSEVEVEHAQGTTPVPVEPETVVTFDLGVLDSLDVLGVEVAGVPDAPMPERLQAAAEGATVVGTLFEPDYEAVNALAPDLIIVGGRSAAVYPELSEIAPTIDLTTDNADFLDSFTGHLETLGEIFGAQDRVADEIDALEARIDEVAALGAEAGTGLIVLTTGGEVSAYGPGSRFGLIHDLLQVAPAATDLTDSTHGDAISFEFILEVDPDHLFVLDRDAAIGESGTAAEVLLDNEIVQRTTAWQADDVHYLDGFDWYLVPGGLRSVTNQVDAIEAALS